MHITSMCESIVLNVQTMSQPGLRSERELHEAFVRVECEFVIPAEE